MKGREGETPSPTPETGVLPGGRIVSASRLRSPEIRVYSWLFVVIQVLKPRF